MPSKCRLLNLQQFSEWQEAPRAIYPVTLSLLRLTEALLAGRVAHPLLQAPTPVLSFYTPQQ